MAQAFLPPDSVGPRLRSGRRGPTARRYVLIGAIAAGAILVASTSAAFLATNGTASASVSTTGSGNAGNVYDSSLPTATGAPTTWEAGGATTPTAPGWSAAAGQVTQVTTAGDVAIVDASGAQTLITVALTNAAAMTGAYSYVNIPIEIYACKDGTATTCTWALDTNQTTTPQYLTFSNASLTFDVNSAGASGVYYEVVVPTGGSMYAYSTATSSDLSASWLVTADLL